MRSLSRARGATPSVSTRTTVTTGLAALLLPICLATPALAEPAAPAAAAPAAAAPAAAAAAPVRKAGSLMRISGPRAAVAPGKQRIGVRLLADGRTAVAGSQVVVQRKDGAGWVDIGRITTNAQGLAVGHFDFRTSTKVRATSAGHATLSPGETSAIPVVVNAALRKAAPAAAPASSLAARAMQVAASQAGKPYRWGSAGPSSFDCSGLIRYAFAKVGKSLPHNSAALARITKPVSKAAAQPGDLVFMRTGGRVTHAGIYAGNGKMVDAPRAGRTVSTRKIWTSNYTVGRVV